MLRCSDNSFYVGSTSHDDVATRVSEHNEGRYRGFTRDRRPVVLVWAKQFDRLEEAQETERRLKGRSRAKKEALVAGNAAAIETLSKRRGGMPKPETPRSKRRDMVEMLHSINVSKQKQSPPRTTHKPRHPEARDPQARRIRLIAARGAGRAPKDTR